LYISVDSAEFPQPRCSIDTVEGSSGGLIAEAVAGNEEGADSDEHDAVDTSNEDEVIDDADKDDGNDDGRDEDEDESRRMGKRASL
jgi:hypothetical protein